MKKARIYLDTSVIGGAFDKEFREPTQRLLDEISKGAKTGVISDLTLDELSDAPEEYRGRLVGQVESLPSSNVEYIITTEEMLDLTQRYLNADIVTQNFRRDALHIAIATMAKVDVLVSWNFRHIVNLAKIRQYNGINLSLGHSLLEIRSPREVLDEN